MSWYVSSSILLYTCRLVFLWHLAQLFVVLRSHIPLSEHPLIFHSEHLWNFRAESVPISLEQFSKERILYHELSSITLISGDDNCAIISASTIQHL